MKELGKRKEVEQIKSQLIKYYNQSPTVALAFLVVAAVLALILFFILPFIAWVILVLLTVGGVSFILLQPAKKREVEMEEKIQAEGKPREEMTKEEEPASLEPKEKEEVKEEEKKEEVEMREEKSEKGSEKVEKE